MVHYELFYNCHLYIKIVYSKNIMKQLKIWWQDLIDPNKPVFTGGLKNPLAWIISIVIASIIIYFRDFN